MIEESTAQPLPLLKPDVEIVDGPLSYDGYPTYIVHEPVSRTYRKVDWIEATILQLLRIEQTVEELLATLNRKAIKVEKEQLLAFVEMTVKSGLTRQTATRDIEELIKEKEARRIHPIKWLLHHYLYFRIPLLKPDPFLSRTLKYIKPLFSSGAILFYITAILLGGYLVSDRLTEYFHSFSYFFNWKGMMWYGLAIIILKAIHEFSHAYIAKYFGAHVPIMGIAFIVLWPVAFCDVTDAWKIKSRKQRLGIALAGITSEAVLAAFALIGWCLTAPGILNSIFFVTSSVSLVSTLAVNLNPSMRFDGYYILMDLWGIDNLQPRSFAVARWFYQKIFFGIETPFPEPAFRSCRCCLMVIYAIGTWIYRFLLYLSIAVLVYYKFTKILGIILFFVEIWWFIIQPLYREMMNVYSKRKLMNFKMAGFVLAICVCSVLFYVSFPFPRFIYSPSIAELAEKQNIYTASAGVIKNFELEVGQSVQKGDIIAVTYSRDNEASLKMLALEKEKLAKRLFVASLQEEKVALLGEIQDQIAQAEDQIKLINEENNQNVLTAYEDGQIYDINRDLHNGLTVPEGTVICLIALSDKKQITAYVKEQFIGNLDLDHEVYFYPYNGSSKKVGTITSINPLSSKELKHASLSSLYGGDIESIQDGYGRINLIESYYEVTVKIDESSNLEHGISGELRIRTKPFSLVKSWTRNVMHILLKETNF